MTYTARIVLQDLEHAIDCHTDNLSCEAFRISWISIVCLLRAVGHVLKKVDSLQSPSLEQAIDQKWKALQATRPVPEIFWEFIEPERNRFLKTYAHAVDRTMDLSMYNEDGTPCEMVTSIDIGRASGFAIVDTNLKLESKFTEGPFAGQHEKNIARRAAQWWREYIDDIDRIVAEIEKRT